MKKSKEFKEFITGDIWLASAISILLKTYPEFKVENSKTLFVFPANGDTYKAISEFNGGISVNCYEYSQMVRKLKVEMLTRRDQALGFHR